MRFTTKTQSLFSGRPQAGPGGHEGITKSSNPTSCCLRVFVSLWLSFLTTAASAANLEDGLTEALRNAYSLSGAEMTVTVQLDAAPPAEAQGIDGVRFANLILDRASGRFSALAMLPSGPLPLSGLSTAMVEVPVLRDMVRRGELIGQDAIDYALIPANRLTSGVAFDMADMVGQAARRTLHPGRPVRAADLMPPIVVAKNRPVTMVYEVGALRLTARGRALADGGAGSVIKVLNIDSKRAVDALIVDSDTVAVIRTSE